MSQLAIGMGQMCSGEDVSKNAHVVLEYVKQSLKLSVHLFPENALFWGESSKLSAAATEIHQTILPWLASELKQLNYSGTLVLGGVPCLSPVSEKFLNRWLNYRSGVWELGYAKRNLFESTVAGQRSYSETTSFVHGSEALKVMKIDDSSNWIIGPSICFDLRFPNLFQEYRKLGATVLAIPSCFTKVTGIAHWHTLLRARAIETQCYVVAPAQTGQSVGGREGYGHSLVVSPWGELLVDAGEVPGLVELKLESAKLDEVRRQIPMHF